MKVLIDTNVLLDVLTKREPFYLDSAKIWSLINEEILEGYISAISANNLYYIIKKLSTQKTAETFTDQILADFKVIDLSLHILKQARTVLKKDFEDLIQYFSAIHEGCDVLVSRDKKGFPSLGLAILTPTELLKKLI